MPIDPANIDLRLEARAIFDEALRCVDAGQAIRRAVRLDGPRITIVDTTIDLKKKPQAIYGVAIGKAAFPMAAALAEILNDSLKEGLLVGQTLRQVNAGTSVSLKQLEKRWRVLKGDHPLPTESSLLAARSAFELLKRADDECALVIFLISGGGSSMIEWPRDESITLADLRTANRLLVSCGANISEINAVRRAFSTVKGGGLAARAPNADQITLIVSDTAKGQESVVASGPTYELFPEGPNAAEVIAHHNLSTHLPKTILQAIARRSEGPESSTLEHLREFYVLLDSETALAAATDEARRRGFVVKFAHNISNQPIEDGCRMLLTQFYELHSRSDNANKVACLISGGEFSCPVRGNGIGGRNAETALRCAIELDELRRRHANGSDTSHVGVLSAGTDGIDGNSPAAGAVADQQSIERALRAGLNPVDFLGRSDAYSFFKAIGDTIETGPTGTNVQDVRILLGG